MIPGEIICGEGKIVLNDGLETRTLEVSNIGDRAVQVGSHFHFFEANRHLRFDRAQGFGFRLDIPAGTAVRFEPGETRTVELVALGGSQRVYGLNNLTCGQTAPLRLAAALDRAQLAGFSEEKEVC